MHGESAYFLATNRNKRSLTLDYDHPRGRELFDKLIAGAASLSSINLLWLRRGSAA